MNRGGGSDEKECLKVWVMKCVRTYMHRSVILHLVFTVSCFGSFQLPSSVNEHALKNYVETAEMFEIKVSLASVNLVKEVVR